MSEKPSRADTPTVSIIVVSYNTCEMTLECLRSVKAETKATFELIVIDNASSDGSTGAIAAEFPEINMIASKENYGFARANNIAAAQATGQYLLLLNPDTVVLDGAIDRLLAFAAEKPDAKIWGGRTLYGDGSLNLTNCWRHMSVWSLFCQAVGLSKALPTSSLFNSEGYGGWKRDSVRAVDIVTGCFFLTKRALWVQLCGFDETFVMYGDEADLCQRAMALGATPMITPDAAIIHYVGASSPARVEQLIMVHRAKVNLIQRYFSGWRRRAGLALLQLHVAIRALVATLLRLAGPWQEVWRRRVEWVDGWPDAMR